MFGMIPYGRRHSDIVKSDFDTEVKNFFNSFFGDAFPSAFFAGHSMKADIRGTDKEYVVEAEIPGVNKEDIRIDLRDDVLTIAVESNEQTDEERENYIRRERRYGSYSRSFHVENVREDDVKAQYDNGILTITLPRDPGIAKKNHRIEIQ